MKQLIIKLVLPLSIICFGTITKWWYVLPEDAPDSMFYGFPLAYCGDGWGTSMSLQIFALEFLTDFLVYFLICFALVFLINRFLKKMEPPKVLIIVLWVFSGLFIALASFQATFPDNIIELKRSYKMEIMETGPKFIWQDIYRPNYDKYHPVKNKN
jgi:amino acid transporter